MKILWLDHYSRVKKCDRWLHTDFALAVRTHVDKLYFYGPELFEAFGRDMSLVPIPFNSNLGMEYITKHLGIDVIIVNTRAATYYPNYFPLTLFPDRPGNEGHCWLPSDFPFCKVLKVCIEEDFHYETDYYWHEQMRFRVILQKHYSQYLRQWTIPVEFFPFSVDTSVFTPYEGERKNKFCFVGASSFDCYPQRFTAHNMLASRGLIDIFKNRERIFGGYIECMHEYVSHLSCGSKYNLTSAKTFEIMASGSVLFTNKFTGIETILDDGSYVTYENDWSDLYEKAHKILGDPLFRKTTIEKALNCINTRHTNDIRVKELLGLIEKYK